MFIMLSLTFIGYIYRDIIPLNFEPILLLMTIVGIWFVATSHKRKIDKRIWVWISVLVFYWLTSVFSSIYHAPLMERADSVLNVVHATWIFIVISFVVLLLKPKIDYFWWLMIVGALVAISLACLEAYQLGWFENGVGNENLGYKNSHHIKYAVIVNSFFIILLGSLPWALSKHKSLFLTVLSVLVLLLVIVILTKARTAWLGWPEAILGWGAYYLYVMRMKCSKAKFKLAVFGLLLFVSVFIYVGSQTDSISDRLEQRAKAAVHDVELYFSGENVNTSLGHRILSYQVAFGAIAETFWLGVGEDEFPALLYFESNRIALEDFDQELVHLSHRTKIIGLSYSHIHNQFLMSFLTKGFLAFLSVVLIFSFLFWHFLKGLKNAELSDKPIWIAGLVFSIASFLVFMPETPLQKSDTSTHFLLITTLLVVFSVLSRTPQEETRVDG